MPTRDQIQEFTSYAAAVPIADCSECRKSYTMNQTDALPMIAAGTWKCPCGGIVRMRYDDVLEAEQTEWEIRRKQS